MKKLLHELYGDMSPWGKIWLYLGAATLAAAAAMSLDFGWGVSLKHAVYLGLLTIIVAFIPDVAHEMWQTGKRIIAVVLAIIAVPLFVIEFGTHAGYTAGLRGSNISEATIQNTKYADSREQVTDHRANLAMWKDRLAKLSEQNGWSATVTAEALRAKLPALELAISQEAANGGCKSKCLARTKERDDVQAQIAIAEERRDLTKQIEATQKLVDKSREQSAATDVKVSAVDHQNKFYIKAVALFGLGQMDAPEIVGQKIDKTISIGMAAAGTGLPALCFFVAGLYRRRKPEITQEPTSTASVPVIPAPPAQPVFAAPVIDQRSIPPVEARYTPPAQPITREIVRTDNAVWRDLNRALNYAA